MSTHQYQALAEPMVPKLGSDAVATDSWQPSFPSAVKRFAISAAAATCIAAPLFVPDVTQPVPTESWRSGTPYPDQIHRITLPRAAQQAFVTPVLVPDVTDVPPHTWRSNTSYPAQIYRTVLPRAAHLVFAQNVDPIPTPVFDSGGSFISTGASDLWQYQAIAGPLEVPGPQTIDTHGWRPSYPNRVPARQGLGAGAQRAHVTDTVLAPSAPTAPDYVSPTRIDLPRRLIQTYRAQSFANDTQWLRPPDAPDLAQWRPLYPAVPTPRLYPRALYTWAQPHFAVVIQVPVLSWTGWYLDPPVRAAQQTPAPQSVEPLYLADVTVTAPDLSWQGRYPAQVYGPRRSPAALTQAPPPPLMLADVTAAAPALSAKAIYPDRVFGRTPIVWQQAYQADKFTAPTVVAAPDLAMPVYPNLVYGKRAPSESPKYFGAEFILDVTLPAPSVSWAPSYPDRVSISLRQPHLENGWWNDQCVLGAVASLPLPPVPATLVASTTLVGTSVTQLTLTGSAETSATLTGTAHVIVIGGYTGWIRLTGTVGS